MAGTRATKIEIQAENDLRETTTVKALDYLTSGDVNNVTIRHFTMFAAAFGATNAVDQICSLYADNRPLRDSILLGLALVALVRVCQE
jgi:hypothetical protein